MHFRIKRLIWVSSAVAFILLALFLTRAYILSQIRVKVEQQLSALKDSGYTVRYDSIEVNTKENRVVIYRLSILRDLDSTQCPTTTFFSAEHITAEGFKLIPLLLKKRLSFDYINFDSPEISIHPSFFNKGGNDKKERREFSISVKEVDLPKLSVTYFDSIGCDPQTRYTSNAKIENFILSFSEDEPPYYDVRAIQTDSIELAMPRELYTIRVNSIAADFDLQLLDIDTIRIIPQVGKIAFGRKKKMETDRIEGIIPYINLYGLQWNRMDSTSVVARKMTTHFSLSVFRDKRLPFKNPLKSLPIDALQNLPIGIRIDSVILNKSFVEYEEYAEEADSAGRVYFKDLYATISNVTNLKNSKAESTRLIAEAKFFGQGHVKVIAEFPLKNNKKNTIEGFISGLDFRKLNEILEPQLKLRAESGHLNKMAFNFTYDDVASAGKLELDYTDLKLLTFRSEEKVTKMKEKRKRRNKRDDDDDDIRTAPLKSFALNTIILKRNIDEDPHQSREGTIEFTRDKRRSIFNYWAKSVFSGIKSAYKIDKLQDSALGRLLDKKNTDE